MSTLKRRRFIGIGSAACCGLAGSGPCVQAASTATKVEVQGAGGKTFMPVAVCGIYCGACPKYLQGFESKKSSDIVCRGCQHSTPNSKCELRACARRKGLDYCWECKTFDTCEKAARHYEKPLYRQAAKRNSLAMKEKGVEVFVQEQERRWKCAACDARYSFFTKTSCPKCGKAIEPLSSKDV